jgi:hypothetical protein
MPNAGLHILFLYVIEDIEKFLLCTIGLLVKFFAMIIKNFVLYEVTQL